MTGAQASYLKTLCDEAGEPFDPDSTKAEASKRIDALQAKTGRGRNHQSRPESPGLTGVPTRGRFPPVPSLERKRDTRKLASDARHAMDRPQTGNPDIQAHRRQ